MLQKDASLGFGHVRKVFVDLCVPGPKLARLLDALSWLLIIFKTLRLHESRGLVLRNGFQSLAPVGGIEKEHPLGMTQRCKGGSTYPLFIPLGFHGFQPT